MKKSSIKKNFAYQMAYEVLILILPFVTSPYIARVIGAEGLGTYSYSYSIAYYFVLFSMLGIKNYGNRAIAQARDNLELLEETFSNICAVHVLVSAVCCIAYAGYVYALDDGGRLYAAIQFLYVASGLFDISWFYFGIEQFKLTVARNMIIRLLNVGCVFLFVKGLEDLWIYCLIMATGNLISQLTLWIPLRKYTVFRKPEWKKMSPHIKPLLILFIPAIAVSLYKYMDKIMIGSMSSKTQLGYYENAEKVINIPMTVIGAFGTVMLPKMSNLIAARDEQTVQRYMKMSMEFVMCLAMALAFGLAAVGTVFAPVFWGEEFTASGTLIMGLSITIPFIAFANIIRTQYLIPNEKDKEYLTSVIAGAVANLVINGLLIPAMGAVGATVGTIIAEITVCTIQVCAVRKDLPLRRYFKSFLPFAFFGLGMFALVYQLGIAMGTHLTTLLLQIVVGGIIYVGACLLYFVWNKNVLVLKVIRHNILRK